MAIQGMIVSRMEAVAAEVLKPYDIHFDSCETQSRSILVIDGPATPEKRRDAKLALKVLWEILTGNGTGNGPKKMEVMVDPENNQVRMRPVFSKDGTNEELENFEKLLKRHLAQFPTSETLINSTKPSPDTHVLQFRGVQYIRDLRK